MNIKIQHSPLIFDAGHCFSTPCLLSSDCELHTCHRVILLKVNDEKQVMDNLNGPLGLLQFDLILDSDTAHKYKVLWVLSPPLMRYLWHQRSFNVTSECLFAFPVSNLFVQIIKKVTPDSCWAPQITVVSLRLRMRAGTQYGGDVWVIIYQAFIEYLIAFLFGFLHMKASLPRLHLCIS